MELTPLNTGRAVPKSPVFRYGGDDGLMKGFVPRRKE